MQKVKAYRNRVYLDWVKTLPCSECGDSPCDPHHIIGMKLGGMGMQAPDTYVMPLCRGCHTHLHNDPLTWFKQWQWVAQTLAQGRQEGIV